MIPEEEWIHDIFEELWLDEYIEMHHLAEEVAPGEIVDA